MLLNVGSEVLPEIMTEEVLETPNEIKKNKALINDEIITDLILEGPKILINLILILFNKCFHQGKIPVARKNL